MINIAFFEDHPIVAKSLVDLFTNNKTTNLLFKATTKSELYSSLDINPTVDILVVDLLAVDVHGLEIFETIHKKYPQIKQLAFTSLTSPILVENLLAVGAKAYVNKNQEIEDLLTAIEIVNEGGIYLPKDYYFLLKRNNSSTLNSSLTEREIEIIQYIIMEYTTADISNQLKISVNTVENHRKSIFQKLDVKNVAVMVREASKLGYVN